MTVMFSVFIIVITDFHIDSYVVVYNIIINSLMMCVKTVGVYQF